MSTTTVTRPGRKVTPGAPGIPGNGHRGNGGRFGPGGGPQGPKPSRSDEFQPEKYRIGMWVGLASILMLFIALTSAYLVRKTKGLGDGTEDWVPLQMPAVLWANTALILLSSITIEAARRALKRADFSAFNRWFSVTGVLGLGFLGGQVAAFRNLRAQGIYVSTNPHSSFFYLLTGLHGIHLFGGLIALTYVAVGGFRHRFGPMKQVAVDSTALYWHFMDGLWLYLFILLFFWR